MYALGFAILNDNANHVTYVININNLLAQNGESCILSSAQMTHDRQLPNHNHESPLITTTASCTVTNTRVEFKFKNFKIDNLKLKVKVQQQRSTH